MDERRGPAGMKIEERLKNNIAVNPASGCWEWTGTKTKGYGRLCIGNRRKNRHRFVYAHRLAYETWVGPIPDGYFVCHRCDNPPCINPQHLFIGTNRENVLDSMEKGRRYIPVGEKQGKAKLTEQNVREARWERCCDGTSYKDLAKKYGVSATTIRYAIKGITWKCVKYTLLIEDDEQQNLSLRPETEHRLKQGPLL